MKLLNNMKLTPVEIFKAMNGDGIENIKNCEGMIVSPVAYHTHTYESQDGKEHTVLVIKNGKDNKMYKTEVQAFIKKFMSYDEAFGELPDEQKPEMVVVLTESKKGNKYVTFDVMDS